MTLWCRLVTEGGIDPLTAWEIPFPDAVALINAWAKHPPLRWMISRFFEFDEKDW